MKTIRIIQILALCLLVSCTYRTDREKPVDKKYLTGYDYRLFQGTPAWELAKAVQDEDKKKIEGIVSKEPELLNYQEPVYGSTLLMLTIRNQQMKPFKILLEHKADISIHNTYDGGFALIEACSLNVYDDKFAEMLIEKGANVNDVQTDIENQDATKTPLMAAAGQGKLGLVKLLVSKGADINYCNKRGWSALDECVMQDYYDIALFLLQNGADYTQPIFYSPSDNPDHNPAEDTPVYLIDVLRADVFDLGSEKYKYKMQIVDFLKSKGVDYRAAPIPEEIKTEIQDTYPDSWQEYLKKY